MISEKKLVITEDVSTDIKFIIGVFTSECMEVSKYNYYIS